MGEDTFTFNPIEDGTNEGDIITWNATTGKWESSRYSTVEKTISGGSITVADGEKHIQLIGEGGIADTLTGITGGSERDEITLWRKADLGYSIVISSDAGLHLQRNRPLTLNANYDNVTLVCKEADVWVEKGGRVSAD